MYDYSNYEEPEKKTASVILAEAFVEEIAKSPVLRRVILPWSILSTALATESYIRIKLLMIDNNWNWIGIEKSSIAIGLCMGALCIGADIVKYPLTDMAKDLYKSVTNMNFQLPAIIERSGNDKNAQIVKVGDGVRYVVPPQNATEKDVLKFANMCLNASSISEKYSRTFQLSGPKFRILRNWSIDKYAFLEWKNDKNHRLGVNLTGRGRHYFKHITTPPPIS